MRRLGLPLIAVICVAYIVVWSRFQLPNITITPQQVFAPEGKPAPPPTTDVTVAKVKYDGVDAKNRPFSITAGSCGRGGPAVATPAIARSTSAPMFAPCLGRTNAVVA